MYGLGEDQMAMLGQVNSSFPTPGVLHLPPTILDAVIPGYSVLAETLLTHIGIDLSFYVSVVALLFAALTAFKVTISPTIDRIFSFITSTVIVDEHDSIFDHILDWLSAQKTLQNHRILRAHTGGRSDDEEEDELGLTNRGISDQIFNFNDFATQIPAKYEPHSSTGFFRHKGHIFRISREAERVQSEWSSAVRDREKFIITVVWRGTGPVKQLIEEARELSFSKRTSTTAILRPTPKAQRGAGNEWQTVSVRPSRSMNTVVLDDAQKLQCVSDINEFLQAARWYSNRGIPYRRGYLFHGKPGTGKTSLSFALAGVFGLEIYCLSLSEITLTEEDLILLFTALPQRCIVLLEDVDAAGISRPEPEKKGGKSKSKKKKSKSTQKSSDGPNPNKLTNAITISGLLNAIDGVATAEGRVLIMTTNYPDKLDSALTRPGRIDMKIEFTLASRQQIEELFLRMYTADEEEGNKQPTKLSDVISARSEKKSDSITFTSDGTQGEDSKEEVSLEQYATRFAMSFPEQTFSPAEIQGYLLMHKKSPEQAARSVGAWVERELSSKRNKEEERLKAEMAKQTATTKSNQEEGVSEKTETPAVENAGAQETPEKESRTDATEVGDVSTLTITESTKPKVSDVAKKSPKKKTNKKHETPTGSASEDSNRESGSDSDSDSSSESDSD
jgi:mitochondrial chaperone BCS1